MKKAYSEEERFEALKHKPVAVLDGPCHIVALKDQSKGYLDYQAAATACLMAQMQGKTFSIGDYLGGSSAAGFSVTESMIKVIDSNFAHNNRLKPL
ncbi:MAG: hypothetical protein BI182_05875 [Acetobacterium sp. MES1]|uniref:hypothetical protein n=1 Tax=Acetobacterium sp. MES1 TaxID=1899015 RepID=UPI000B9CF6F3|nr:hypothetical protein [Acetobacterium sp. MES1]OXS25258.1 MAG: hypothetical protein BI182_05875 [Acetobacterium sp. MES1]